VEVIEVGLFNRKKSKKPKAAELFAYDDVELSYATEPEDFTKIVKDFVKITNSSGNDVYTIERRNTHHPPPTVSLISAWSSTSDVKTSIEIINSSEHEARSEAEFKFNKFRDMLTKKGYEPMDLVPTGAYCIAGKISSKWAAEAAFKKYAEIGISGACLLSPCVAAYYGYNEQLAKWFVIKTQDTTVAHEKWAEIPKPTPLE
jgi:hypothetical protein